MADQPSGTAADEQRELAALRRRAFGPDADIFGDPDALARLTTLEDQVRLDRAPVPEKAPVAASAPGERARPEPALPVTTAAAGEPVAVVVGADPQASRTPRWHTGLVTGAAALALALGAAAWTSSQPPDSEPGVAETGATGPAAPSSEPRSGEYEEGYRVYLDGLREQVLTLPGGGDVAERLIRDQLRPYGILYGRTVGAGPTVDDRFCMVIANLPEASITCVPIQNAYANPVSVVLPSWYSDAESDLFTGLGEPISFTLMPGGSVVAVPADAADVAAGSDVVSIPADSLPVPEAPAPTPIASPPPGWQ